MTNIKILILGGGGMVGQKLLAQLLRDGLNGQSSLDITLYDMAFPPNQPASVTCVTGNITTQFDMAQLATQRFDVIFHLASIVSGEAETDFDKGWQTNLWPTWHLLEALRVQSDVTAGAYRPRFVFTSSIAVFGGPYPEKIDDDFKCSPQTSYGAQKAICEHLIQDFSRKGYIDGLSLRLPTICVRPGKANLAASSFFSGIIREPLAGIEAILPVSDQVRHWHASPRSAAGFLCHAAKLSEEAIGTHRALNLPGISCTVAEQIEALRIVAGADAVKLITPKADPAIDKIVSGWPRNFDPARALELGFSAESSFEEIIRVYIEEDAPRR
ncbi:MAG: SDR family oxidoreductase [Marinovum sp.]|nr:SDR family oxidoreductase [Marinovum sp.]